jgi:hypothetical protein
MTDKGKLVLQGYFALPDNEKKEVEKVINDYNTAPYTEGKLSAKRAYSDSNRITMGPVQTGCPCCGR